MKERVGNQDFIESLFKTADQAEPGHVNGDAAEEARATFAADFSEDEGTPPAPDPVDMVKERKLGKLGKSLQNTYGMIGMTLSSVDPHCGGQILMNAENMAMAMEDLARENQSVRRVLNKLMEGSAWGMVVAAHMPVITAVAAHHVFPRIAEARAKKQAEKESQQPITDHPATAQRRPPFAAQKRPQPQQQPVPETPMPVSEEAPPPNGATTYRMPDSAVI